MFEATAFPSIPTASAIRTRRRMVRLWTNFAVFG